jgi:peptide/nickel transport system permease protein
MLSFLVKRLFQGIFVIVGLSILIFIIARIVPGDPARMSLGPRAPQFAVDELRREMHLDKSLPVQYFYWAEGVFRGDFGKSINTKRAVNTDIREFLPATLELALLSGILFIILAILLGLLAAKHHDKWVDNLIRGLSYVGIALPAFVVAELLLLLFGYVWPIIPVLGRLSPETGAPTHITGLFTLDSLLTGNFTAFFNALAHLILPALALATGPLFQEARLLRASLVDNMGKEYISVATGYGLPSRVITKKYLLKPSFIPVVSVMGMDLASLMGNAFLVEKIFDWPGISRYGMNAMMNKDLNAISAVILVFGIIFFIVNIIVDIIVASLDPRIRLGAKS